MVRLWLWHKRLAHIHMHHLNRIAFKGLVIGLPKLKFERDKMCEACQDKCSRSGV